MKTKQILTINLAFSLYTSAYGQIYEYKDHKGHIIYSDKIPIYQTESSEFKNQYLKNSGNKSVKGTEYNKREFT